MESDNNEQSIVGRLPTKQYLDPSREYRTIVQMIVRHRGCQVPGFQLDTRGVGTKQSKEFFYLTEKKTCRFFQVKYSSKKKYFSTYELFATLAYKKKCLEKTQMPAIELLSIFETFCKMKQSERFDGFEIEEMTIVTNMILDNTQTRQNFLVLWDKLYRDKFLYFEKGSGKKYSLGVNALRKNRIFMNDLIEIYDKIFPRKYWPDMENLVITEFFEKVSVVVGYPDIEQIKELTKMEIFFDEAYSYQDLNMLLNSLIHAETEEMLRLEENNDAFLLCEAWNERVSEVKRNTNIQKSKVNVTTSTSNRNMMELKLERMKVMCEDITKFLKHDKQNILHCSNVKNVELVCNMILNIINEIKGGHNENNFRRYIVHCVKLQSLLEDSDLDYYLSRNINIFVITSGSHQLEDYARDLATKLVSALMGQTRKMILISTCNNSFISSVKTLSGKKCLEKHYNADFCCLNKTAQKEVLEREVLFQGKTANFGALFNNDLNFACNVIDEDILLNVTDNGKMVTVLDTNAFVSPGYSKNYYIEREIIQKYVHFDVVKEKLKKSLFFIIQLNGVETNLQWILIKKGVDKHCFQKWPNTTGNFKNYGIVLRGDKDRPNEDVFREIKKENLTVHWLALTDSDTHLVLLESSYKYGEEETLPTVTQKLDEVTLVNSLGLQKIVILVGDSGAGKSTVLTRIANNICAAITDLPVWMVKVNLRTFFGKKRLKDIGDLANVDTAISLVVEMGSFNDSSKTVSRKMITEGLKKSHTGNFSLILFLDGFNEISILHQNKTCSLVKTLHSECNVKQIWVASQTHDKEKLENEFKVPAYFLSTLNDEKQIELMVKYWATKTGPPCDEEVLSVDASRALQVWKNLISDDRLFTGIPLNVIMLADVILKDRKIDENMDLYSVYETFVSKKISIFNEEPSECHNCMSTVKQVKDKIFQNSIREVLQELAVKIILPKTFHISRRMISECPNMNAFAQFKNSMEGFQRQGIEMNYQVVLSKIGILSMKEPLNFYHYTFAQFFVIEYLIANLSEANVQYIFVNLILSEKYSNLFHKFRNYSLEKLSKRICRLTGSKRTKHLLQDQTKYVSLLAEEKLDYVLILLLSLFRSSDYEHFLELWGKNEFQSFTEENETVIEIVNCLQSTDIFSLPCKLRTIILIMKANVDDTTNLETIVDKLSIKKSLYVTDELTKENITGAVKKLSKKNIGGDVDKLSKDNIGEDVNKLDKTNAGVKKKIKKMRKKNKVGVVKERSKTDIGGVIIRYFAEEEIDKNIWLELLGY